MVAALPAIALGTAGTAATATAAATVGTAGLFGTAGAFSFMQTASTLGTMFGISSSLAAGKAENAAAQSSANWENFRAEQERTRGRLESAQIKSDLARDLSTSIAVGAAQGVDISSGSPVSARNAAITDANRSWTIAEYNAENAASTREFNAYQMREQGKNAIRSSRARAVGIASDYAMKQYDRGMTF